MPSNPVGPMLAKSYDPAKTVFPAWVQAKLDGIRCLAYVGSDGGVTLKSRDDKPIIMPHVQQALEAQRLPPGVILDGELYLHGLPFQELSGHVRRSEVDSRKTQIGYHIYDVMRGPDGMYLETRPYVDRAEYLVGALLETLSEDTHGVLNFVEFRIAKSHEEVQAAERTFVGLGYEGAMVRTKNPIKPTKKNPDGGVVDDYYHAEFYGHSRRSDFLLKVKSFDDAEAKIIGVEEEVDQFGTPKGRAGKFVMQEADGTEFRASGITDAMKDDAWANPEKYIGQTSTFKFFGRSTEGTPRHPNFKALRPEGELDAAS